MLDNRLPMKTCKFLFSAIFQGITFVNFVSLYCRCFRSILLVFLEAFLCLFLWFDLGNFCLPILKVIVSLRSMESPDEPWKAVGICVLILRIISFFPPTL